MMTTRYEHEPLAHLWHLDQTYQQWAMVERQVARAQYQEGLIPEPGWQAIRAAPTPDLETVQRYELTTGHDVAAFLRAYAEGMAEPGPVWLHHGLTSSDLVDTANAYRFHLATEELVLLAGQLAGQIDYLVTRYDGLVRVGRTHGQQAEPVLFSDQLNRWLAALARARDAVIRESPPMKLSGAVGSYAYNSRAVESTVARRLGLRADPSASQVVARDHYSSWAFGVVQLANVCERIATEIRLGAQSEIAEFSEGFDEGRVGSTAMPHKRNPVRSERICGLARVARGFLVPILETDAGLWGERDISNSSVERIALRNLVVLVGWMLAETQGILFDLVVHDKQMARHLADLPLPTPAAQLYVAAQFGHTREYAHRMIAAGRGDELVRSAQHQAALDRWADPGLYR